MIKRRWLAIVVIFAPLCAQNVTAPTPIRKVEPEWGPELSQAFYVTPLRVEIVVDPDGVPFSLSNASGLSDNVVSALARWRFAPGERDGRPAAFSMVITVPIRHAIEPEVERWFRPFREEFLPNDLSDALKAGAALDVTEVGALEKEVSTNPQDRNARATLLRYYAGHQDNAGNDVRPARLQHIAWIVKNAPESPLCSHALIQINALDAPLKDPSGYTQVRDIWLNEVAAGGDEPVIEHAANFLKIADPEKALALLAPNLSKSAEAARLIGEIHALTGLGVTAIDLTTGHPASAGAKLPDSNLASASRSVLLATKDVSVLMWGLATVAASGRSLAAAKKLPEGYVEFCEAILKRAKEIQPAITTSCDPTLLAKPGPPSALPQRIRVGGNVQQANRIKVVQPKYPGEAKTRRIQGTIRLQVIINKQGLIEHMMLLSGPLPLYEAARDAVKQWVYRPTLLDGQPVEVVTQIEVNFRLQ